MSRHFRTIRIASIFLLLLWIISCSPKINASNPASITRSFFNAINNGHAETAAAHFSKEGEFTWAFGQPKGIEKIENYFKTNLIPLKTKVDIIELTVDGANITGTFKITSTWLKNAFPEGVPVFKMTGIITDGKINSMLWTTSK